MAGLSYYLEAPGGKYYGAGYYAGFSLLYILLVFFLKRSSLRPRTLLFFSGLLFLGSPPLFENDHYRYLWEGRVVTEGMSPYLYAPSSKKLDHIEYSKRKAIAYNKLTSIYPPLAQVIFASVSFFKYQYALIFMQFLALLLLCWIIPFWFKESNTTFLLVLPFLLKEGVQSFHIDLFAVIFFTMAIGAQNSRTYVLLFLSFLTKLLSVIVLPYLILKEILSHRRINPFVLLFPFAVLLFYLFVPFEATRDSGAVSYVEHWYWNSLLMSLLLKLKLGFSTARLCLMSGFVVSYGLVLFYGLRNKWENKLAFRTMFCLLFLFTPVLHPWYLFWLLPLLPKSKHYALAISFSFVAYLPYGQESWELAGTMVLFLLLVRALYFDMRSLDEA